MGGFGFEGMGDFVDVDFLAAEFQGRRTVRLDVAGEAEDALVEAERGFEGFYGEDEVVYMVDHGVHSDCCARLRS